MPGQLMSGVDAGGERHFLDGRAVHAGDGLELQLADDRWVGGRYEWDFKRGTPALFYMGLAGGGQVSFHIPSSAILRWPALRRPSPSSGGDAA